MSDPGSTSSSDWNRNESSVNKSSSNASHHQTMLSMFPWRVKCLPSANSVTIGGPDANSASYSPTSPPYFRQAPVNNPYLATSTLLPQPDSPSSIDDYPEFAATGSADEDTSTETRADSSCCSNKQKQTAPAHSIRGCKSFTIDAILGLEDLASSLKSKGNNNTRLSSINNQELPSGRTNYHFNHQQQSDGVTSASSSSSSSRSKRVRTIFSAEQLEKLEAEFARQQYMVGPERLVLAASLRLSESQVKVWFQNRRIKWRKQHLETRHPMRFPNWQADEHQLVHHRRTFSQMFPSAEGFDDALESLSD